MPSTPNCSASDSARGSGTLDDEFINACRCLGEFAVAPALICRFVVEVGTGYRPSIAAFGGPTTHRTRRLFKQVAHGLFNHFNRFRCLNRLCDPTNYYVIPFIHDSAQTEGEVAGESERRSVFTVVKFSVTASALVDELVDKSLFEKLAGLPPSRRCGFQPEYPPRDSPACRELLVLAESRRYAMPWPPAPKRSKTH